MTTNHQKTAKIYMSMRLVSEANARGHWAGGHARAKAQKAQVLGEWLRVMRPVVSPPCTVTITRIAPRRMDCDNLQRAAKAVRDAAAEHIVQADDGDERITWDYKQVKGKAKTYAVSIEVVACD